jgi:membrane-bound serine protease (ClpP class)
VIEIDTPGGLDLAMRDIIKKIMSSNVPVVVYVSPGGARAASAGAIIALSAHITAMAPGTNIGAAHPVNMGGEKMDETMSKKVENDAAAYAESIAEKRNRNKEWAVKAVRESVSVGETEALKMNIIDLISPDIESLIKDINGMTVELNNEKVKLVTEETTIIYRKMGLRENILKALSNPNIAYILFLIGLAGLYFELSNPGAVFPGVTGALALILAFYSMQSLSANYAGVLLIILSAVFFMIELKVTSYGLLTLGGIIAMTLGSLMLFDSPVPYLRLSYSVIFTMVALMSSFFIIIVFLVIKSQTKRPQTGNEGLINMCGEASTDILETGKVFVHGEYWNAKSITPVNKGDKISVVKVDGMLLTIVKI